MLWRGRGHLERPGVPAKGPGHGAVTCEVTPASPLPDFVLVKGCTRSALRTVTDVRCGCKRAHLRVICHTEKDSWGRHSWSSKSSFYVIQRHVTEGTVTFPFLYFLSTLSLFLQPHLFPFSPFPLSLSLCKSQTLPIVLMAGRVVQDRPAAQTARALSIPGKASGFSLGVKTSSHLKTTTNTAPDFWFFTGFIRSP